MANKDRKFDAMVDELEEQPVKEAPAPALKDARVVAKAPQLVISFDRWFSSLGKPAHWKSGMKAFASTSGKKTLDAWARLFENY